MLAGLAAVALGALAEVREAAAQIYVVPRRAGKSNVRTFDFQWRSTELLVDQPLSLASGPIVRRPSKDDDDDHRRDPNRSGGIRLYFYERESEIAERAAEQIVATYADLADRFRFVPPTLLPYVLYSSYQEFLQTNLFPVEEGVLGVTSTQDLTLTLPYFGDYRLFREVSRHEMSHQFTIQKAHSISPGSYGDPMGAFPLWFTEGLAELYAHRGLDPETALVTQDLALNPDLERGYGLLRFFEDRPGSVLWTYKVGQIRCVFLEEVYGPGTVQRLLEAAAANPSSIFERSNENAFPLIAARVLGEGQEKIAARFEAWLKDRAIAAYLRARQSAATVDPLRGFERPDVEEIVQSMRTAPNGEVLLYRRIDGTTGQSALVLLDARAPEDAEKVVSDGRPGVESLHPVYDQSFDVSDRAIAFVAESNGRDLLYVQPYTRRAERVEDPHGARGAGLPGAEPTPEGEPVPEPGAPPRFRAERQRTEALHALTTTVAWSVDLSLGDRSSYDLAQKGLIALFSPALSPDGNAVAFIGLDRRGQRDVYVLRGLDVARDDEDLDLERLTNDGHSERGVSWGPRGVIYTSDATETGHFNLFLVDPATGAITRLTREARDHAAPAALADGRVLFTAWRDGRSNVYEVTDRGVVQRTDVATGLFDPGPGPRGGLWALHYRAGARRPVRVARAALLDLVPTPGEPEASLPQGPREAVSRAGSNATTRSSTTTLAGGATTTATIADTATATLTPGLQRPLSSAALAIRDAKDYGLLDLGNWHLDNIFGILGAGGGGVFGRVMAAFSDKLRLNGVLVDIAALGAFELTEGVVLYMNQASHATWGFGPFQSLQFRLDPTFPRPTGVDRFFSAERFYGGLGILRWPFNRFFHVQAELALGGTDFVIDRGVRDYLGSLPAGSGFGSRLDEWNAANEMHNFQTQLTLRAGWDTLRYHPRSGPIAGSSLVFEGSAAVQPTGDELWGSGRVDAQHFFHIDGRTAIMTRLGAGTIFGGLTRRQFFLSSFDTLRGVEFGDLDFLLGSKFLYSTAELQVPLDAIVALAFLSSIQGVAGVDFGGVGESVRRAWDKRVLDFALGFNFGIGPIVLRLHFARAVDTGVLLPPTSGSRWVTNFSLGWLYF